MQTPADSSSLTHLHEPSSRMAGSRALIHPKGLIRIGGCIDLLYRIVSRSRCSPHRGLKEEPLGYDLREMTSRTKMDHADA